MKQKRHAILQNYIKIYMVLIVYHHMLHMLMFIMAFCFFNFLCYNTSNSCSVLGQCISCSHYIKCSDCLLKIKPRVEALFLSVQQCIEGSRHGFQFLSFIMIERCQDPFHVFSIVFVGSCGSGGKARQGIFL